MNASMDMVFKFTMSVQFQAGHWGLCQTNEPGADADEGKRREQE